jgi:hypothetical protein
MNRIKQVWIKHRVPKSEASNQYYVEFETKHKTGSISAKFEGI